MKAKITILALVLCLPLFLAAQKHSWDGNGVAPNSKFRALTICINIIYDVHPDTNQTDGSTNVWPIVTDTLYEGINVTNTIPPFLLDITDTSYISGNTHGMTRLYGESSFDSLQVTGDFIVVNLRESRVIYSYGSFTYSNICKTAFNYITTNVFSALYGHNSPSDYCYNNVQDAIPYAQVLIRNITKKYGGFNPGEGQTLTSPPYQINIGNRNCVFHKLTIQCVGVMNFSLRPTNVLTHEFAHTLLGGNGFHTSGGNHRATFSFSPFIGIQRGYGIIGASGNALIGCNGYERWRLHWKHPSSIDYISARNPMNTLSVVSDVSVADGNTSFLLRDFVTYGDAVRIRLPYKSKAACSNQYIWLENHKVGLNDKLDFYDYSLFDSCRPQGNPGIYAYYQVGRDILESPNSSIVWNEYYDCDNLRFIPAEGYYDYHKVDVDTPYNCQCINWDEHYYYHTRGNSNPLCGAQDLQSHFSPRDTDNILNRKMEYYIWRKMIGNNIIDSLVQMGDERDAFSTHSKINMGTNPSTCNAKTFYNRIYLNAATKWLEHESRNNDTTFLTGLSIEMDFNNNRDAIVNIRWDDWDITNDARWTGSIALKDTAILNTPYNILLTQNETPAQVYRDSVTGTFSPRTVMVCHTNSYFEQKPNTTVELEQSSTLALRSGSRYVIGDSAQLVVGAGCTLKVEYGAFVDVAGSGKIVIDSGGVAEIHGTVALDSLCRIFVNRGGLLLLDGGKLTDCSNNKMWQGIRLSGDKSLPQSSLRQGKVILRNGARIEHARTANLRRKIIF